MTKEELKKEAQEQVNYHTPLYIEDFIHGYLAGAEPREKRIEELIALINAERERQEKCDDVHLRTIAALEKENAELKDDNKVMADNYSKMEQKFFDNLTKAKELLKRYVPYRQITDSKAYKDLAEETEQFLKE